LGGCDVDEVLQKLFLLLEFGWTDASGERSWWRLSERRRLRLWLWWRSERTGRARLKGAWRRDKGWRRLRLGGNGDGHRNGHRRSVDGRRRTGGRRYKRGRSRSTWRYRRRQTDYSLHRLLTGRDHLLDLFRPQHAEQHLCVKQCVTEGRIGGQ
jgi:hypothetical protein